MNEKTELSLEPQEGEFLPAGKMPTLTEVEVNALAVIETISKVEVLANTAETVKGVEALKASYLPIVEKAKKEIANVKSKADFDRAKEYRLSIRNERIGFTKTIDAELSARKLVIKSADEGKKLVEAAFKSLEAELDAEESPVDERLKVAAAAKKALADALAKLKNHTINPLLPAADIEKGIEFFRLSFCDSDYQESQDAADAIFESKMVEFEAILAAAVTREENEEKVRTEQARNYQRSNIAISFPIAEISGYATRSASDIQSRINWIAKVDMAAFELVLDEAESAKQSCLNMLNAFLPMAVAREAKEAADKAEAERVSGIKAMIKYISDRPSDFIGKKSSVIREALIDIGNMGNAVSVGDFAEFKNEAELTIADAIERLTIILNGTLKKEYLDDWDLAILQYATWCENKADEQQQNVMSNESFNESVESVKEAGQILRGEIEVVDSVVSESDEIDPWSMITASGELKNPIDNNQMIDSKPESDVICDLEHVEEQIIDESGVFIPVKYLSSLIYAAEQASKHCGLDDDDTITAIEFAKSLI